MSLAATTFEDAKALIDRGIASDGKRPRGSAYLVSTTDPNRKGAPSNHVVPVRDVRLSAGAEFIVVICGEIMTMPGLPKVPSANTIRLNAQHQVEGLF